MKTSLTGYKKNSKDRNEPLLEIPSNSITMEGVTHPVVSVLEDGSFKVMKPNENYLFNTKSVIEIPVRQRGGYAFDYMKGEYQKNEPLPEVTIKDNAPKSLSDFWKRYKNQIFEDNKHSLAGSLFAAPVQTVVDLPQALSTYYLDRQKNTEPSKALGIKNPVAAFATDTVLDPVSLIGGILAKGTKITKSTKLKKAVKANSIGSTDDMLFRIFEDSKLKDYKQEDVLSLFEEFKTRIQTPEGKKRLKELGVSEQDIEHLVNHTKVKADPKSVGYHWNNTVGMHPSLSGDVGKNILRHELEHAVQGFSPSGKTSIDKLLENLELRSSPSKKGVSKSFSDKELRDVEVKNIVENDLSDAQDAVDYFSSGSNGREKSAFLAEMQQYMLNKKIIKHPYDKITVDHVREAIAESAFDTDYPLRIAKIIKPNNKNYEILSEGLNKLATTAPIVALNNTDMKNKKQKGGLINKFESYLSSLKEEDQDQVIDYIESLGSDEQEMFLKGGMTMWKKYQQGGMTPIEVEHDETLLNPDGELYGFKGKTHAQGGIDILAEGGSKIFSEFSKAPTELIKTVLGKETKKKMSYADLSKKFDTTKWSKILKNPDSDQYEKETAKLKMSGNLAMLETIFQTQEEEKMKSGKNSEYQYGGPVLPQKKMYTSFWDTRQDIEMGKDVEGLTIEQQLTPLQQVRAMYNQLPEVTITGKRPTYPGNSQYDLVVTETEPSTMASSPNRKTSPVYFGKGMSSATKTLPIVNPNDTSVAPLPSKGNPIKTRTSSQATQPVSQSLESRGSVPNLPTIPSLELPDSLESINKTPLKMEQVSTSTQTPDIKTSKNPFGIGHKLAGTILDIGLALGDTLTVQNPQYRDLRKSPLFSRFVDFDDKEAGRNLALNIQQIQNSNMPEEVKQARIANLNAQYQDHTAKVAFGNAQRYETKINQDTEKLQTYINNNIDQHFQDVERYNQQKAKVDYLKDQFHAQQKSRVVGSIRNYLDYAEETRIKNQLNSENYRVNPITGRIDFLGNKQDALKKKEMEMQQYAQNAVPVKNLPNGAVLARTPQGVEIIIDSTGKATVVKG